MRYLKGELFLLITAVIWGFAFVFQNTASDYLGPSSFNGIRFLVGAISLMPILLINKVKTIGKITIKKGIILGIIMAIAANFQQYGVGFTTSGKAGFISSLYMIFVPLIGIFYGNKTKKNVWFALILATIGLYLINGASFYFEFSDIVLIGCAIFFALHIIYVDKFAANENAVLLSCIQYLTCGTLTLALAFIFEDINLNSINNGLSSILYTGILSTGVAYTLQMIGQKNTEPAIASIIMSLESVFSVIGGMLLLNERMNSLEIFGCLIMFVAVLLSQRKEEK